MWQYIRAKFRKDRNLIAFLHWALLFRSIFSNISKFSPYVLTHSLWQVNWETYWKTTKVSMFNVVVVSIIFQHTTYPLVVLLEVDMGRQLPSLTTTVWQLFVSVIVVEIGFYYFHR